MQFNTLIKNLSQFIKFSHKNNQPTDALVSKLLRSKKFIGSKERRFISESIFTIFRNLTLMQNASNHIFGKIYDDSMAYEFYTLTALLISEFKEFDFNYDAKNLLMRIYPNRDFEVNELVREFLLSNNLININDITLWDKNTQSFISQLALQYKSSSLSNDYDVISNIYSLPEWISEDISLQNISPAALAKSLNSPASVCIRLSNEQHKSAIISMLQNQEIPFRFSELVPNCIILDKRAKIDNSDEYKSGLFEIQDEGSQFISYALSPKGKCTILDACAGAGGKTLHLSDLCPSATSIIAADNNYLRLKELPKRLSRYDKSNISTIHIKSMEYKDLKKALNNKLFDYVLVDAPCTGIGTARRDPLKKYRINPKIVQKMQSIQLEIINTYSQFVKPGGILVYATCSFLSSENTELIRLFLDKNPNFIPDNLYDIFKQQGINAVNIQPDSHYYNLYPHIHNTDGFFMARMKRVN